MFIVVLIGDIPLCALNAHTAVFIVWGFFVGLSWDSIWYWFCDKVEKHE